jgi:hypothetical protein
VRTYPRIGWRSGVAGALATVVGQPSLWLLGALGFMLRGGVLLLTAAIVAVPTPVELRILLGENLGSSGLTPGFIGLLVLSAGLLVLLVLGILALLAYTELASFERLAADSEVGDRDGARARAPVGGQRRRLLAALFAVQLLALAALAVAALPLIGAIIDRTYEEIVRPGLGGTIYIRVLAGIREPLFVFIAVLVAIEMFSALATRRLLVRGFGLSGRPAPETTAQFLRAVPLAVLGAFLRPLFRPLPTLATLVLVWAASLAALVPLSWGLAVAWQSIRTTYLGSYAAGGGELLGLGLVTLALAAVWVVGLLLLGFVAALRAALWSVDALR